ncbi:hypothetical protein VKI21_14005 [Cyanobacterium aponinum UTEX 3222]|uniref:WD40/YVTN/BNR-like repeat-containing protein n=1 Tax=Cyanobacterium aponinum TaxID=379064 RepID=UPI0030859064|nr:hypothetical protein VKI21_14005 [Cyanobacterium aponinum UTEX 3222]
MKYSKFPQRLLIFSVFLSLFLPVNNFSWANPLPLTEINNSINMAKNLESSPFGGHVHALAINPLTNELFLGARPIYNSQDGGKTWNAIAIPKSKPRANVTSIIIDPRNPEIMYATGHGLSVIKSVDGGKTWAVKNKGLNSDSTEAITIDVYDSNKLYLAVLGDGLYRSQDAGESWQRISDFPKNQEIRTLASVGYPTGMGGIWLYAGVDDGVTKSPDCFCGWDKLANEGLPKKRIYSLASDPQNFQTLYAGTQLGVYKTEDAGKSWHLVKEGITDAIISVNPRNSQQIYAVSSDGQLWLSNNSGNNWEKITP